MDGMCFSKFCINFQSFLKGETQIPSDEAFQIAVTNFQEIFLKSERVTGVCVGGGLSYHDTREIFKHQIEKVIIRILSSSFYILFSLPFDSSNMIS